VLPDGSDAKWKPLRDRLLSDVMVCLKFRLIATYRFLNQDPAPLAEAGLKIHQLMESFGSVYEDWFFTEYPA
jgi:hypothetical protein